jgi:hypothetical protein
MRSFGISRFNEMLLGMTSLPLAAAQLVEAVNARRDNKSHPPFILFLFNNPVHSSAAF